MLETCKMYCRSVVSADFAAANNNSLMSISFDIFLHCGRFPVAASQDGTMQHSRLKLPFHNTKHGLQIRHSHYTCFASLIWNKVDSQTYQTGNISAFLFLLPVSRGLCNFSHWPKKDEHTAAFGFLMFYSQNEIAFALSDVQHKTKHTDSG